MYRAKRFRVSYRGVVTLVSPPQEILKLSDYYSGLYVLFGKFVPDCVRSNLKGSKFSRDGDGGRGEGGGGICPQTPPSSHACLRTLLSSC